LLLAAAAAIWVGERQRPARREARLLAAMAAATREPHPAGRLAIQYPLDGTVFPSDIVAPTFRCRTRPRERTSGRGGAPQRQEPEIAQLCDAASWRRARSAGRPEGGVEGAAGVRVHCGRRRGEGGALLSGASVVIRTSPDDVGDPSSSGCAAALQLRRLAPRHDPLAAGVRSRKSLPTRYSRSWRCAATATRSRPTGAPSHGCGLRQRQGLLRRGRTLRRDQAQPRAHLHLERRAADDGCRRSVSSARSPRRSLRREHRQGRLGVRAGRRQPLLLPALLPLQGCPRRVRPDDRHVLDAPGADDPSLVHRIRCEPRRPDIFFARAKALGTSATRA